MSKLIVGLGNPGLKYAQTRHNLGFKVLEALAARFRGPWRESLRRQGIVAKIEIEKCECSLLMPTTFMNNSGISVKKFIDHKPVALEDILVVSDDVTLPFGTMRLRSGGGAGGHNGLKSIIEHLESDQFTRLRLGISEAAGDRVDYVLGHFAPAEKKALPDFINNALDCIICWVIDGAPVAMNRFN